MKKPILLFLLLINCCFAAVAQDLIVTQSGDSINCKINRIKQDNIYFTFKYKNEIRNTLLPVTEIKDHQTGYFEKPEIPLEKLKSDHSYPHLRIAINGGYAYRTSKVSGEVGADFQDFENKLKSGYNWGGDLTYYFSEPLGIGVKFSSFNASNSMDNIYVEDANGNRRYGKLSEDVNISFIGPSFSSRFLNRNKTNAFLMNLALGYMGYTDNAIVVDKYKMSGSTMGLAFDLGYDFTVSKKLILGAQMSIISGVLSSYKLSNGYSTQEVKLDKEDYEGLARIELSLGLRFSK